MELVVTFKAGLNPDEYAALHPMLPVIVQWLAHSLDVMHCSTEITSMVRKANSIVGESNVHATGRAIDLVPRARDTKPGRIQQVEMKKLADMANMIWRRNDQKPTCLWHNQAGLGYHFHVQVTMSKDYVDLDGKWPR